MKYFLAVWICVLSFLAFPSASPAETSFNRVPMNRSTRYIAEFYRQIVERAPTSSEIASSTSTLNSSGRTAVAVAVISTSEY